MADAAQQQHKKPSIPKINLLQAAQQYKEQQASQQPQEANQDPPKNDQQQQQNNDNSSSPQLATAPLTARTLARRTSRTRSMSHLRELTKLFAENERTTIEEKPFEEISNHLRADSDAIHNEPIDLEMMLYQVQKRNTKKTKCLEMCFYILFLIFVTMYCFLFKNITGSFWVHESTKSLLVYRDFPCDDNFKYHKDFRDIQTPQEYFLWLEKVAFSSLFQESMYNGNTNLTSYQRYLNMQNKLIGGVRIRQHRARTDSCPAIAAYAPPRDDFDGNCYGPLGGTFPWSLSRTTQEDTRPFGFGSTKFTWGDCNQIGGGWNYYGSFIILPCSGFSQFIPFNETLADAVALSQKLQKSRFIDRATRSVMVEFFMYNTNLNTFTSVKLSTEWVSGGAVIPTWQTISFKLRPFRSGSDIAYFFFSMMTPLFIIGYMIYFAYSAYFCIVNTSILDMFYNFWNYLEVLLFLSAIMSFILRLILVSHSANNIDITAYVYPTALEEATLIFKIDTSCSAILCLIAWLQIFKYFSLNERLNLLAITVGNAIFELMMVLISFFIVIVAFAISGYVIFGYDIEEYRTIVYSFLSVMRVILGDYAYERMRNENRSLFPFYFVALIISGFFVMLNMFLAVINDHFSDANKLVSDSQLAYDPFKIANSLKKEVTRIIFGTTSKNSTQRYTQTVISKALVDQGDEEIIEKLKNFKETKGIPTLTSSNLAGALGGPPESVLKRVMARFDEDKSGTIDLDELEKQTATVDAKSALKQAAANAVTPSLALSETMSEVENQFDDLEEILKIFKEDAQK